MELRTLRYFVTIAQQGTMTGAAEKLYVSQPALSRQVADLEAELGCSLFTRRGKRISLTEDGELFYHKAYQIVEMADAAKRAFSDTAHHIEGDVFVGIGESPNVRGIFRVATELSRNHPGITFHFTTGTTADLRYALISGRLDYMVAYGRGDVSQGLESRRLPTVNQVVLYVRSDHQLAAKTIATPQDLLSGRIVVAREFFGSDAAKSWLGDVADRLDVAATYNLPFNGVAMVEAGLGDFMLNFDGLVPTSNTSLKRIELESAPESAEFLVWLGDRKFTRAALLFKERLFAEAGE
ncbi:MAG: LysR family transcriptional regulator [Eggerthellaceae bacterium]|nr:LysR family transcriptional regulator [Eggerthellaceae bacterium]